jgi:hypothetical protein
VACLFEVLPHEQSVMSESSGRPEHSIPKQKPFVLFSPESA